MIKKIKMDSNSKLMVKEVIKSYIGMDGQTYFKTRWVECLTPLDIGSLAKPNEKIIAIKYEDTTPQDISNIFGGMFGGKR